MNAQTVTQFFLGGASMACVVVGLFFLRFWRKTHDRLFAIFAIAFWVLLVNRVFQEEVRSLLFYTVRLVAFLLILLAILDKNRSNRSLEKP